MIHYFVAQTRINDRDEYAHYLERFDEIFSRFKGEYLAIDETPALLEGNWDYNKSVLIRFNSKEDFEAWYYSEDYQEIMKYRTNSSDSDIILIKGLE